METGFVVAFMFVDMLMVNEGYSQILQQPRVALGFKGVQWSLLSLFEYHTNLVCPTTILIS